MDGAAQAQREEIMCLGLQSWEAITRTEPRQRGCRCQALLHDSCCPKWNERDTVVKPAYRRSRGTSILLKGSVSSLVGVGSPVTSPHACGGQLSEISPVSYWMIRKMAASSPHLLSSLCDPHFHFASRCKLWELKPQAMMVGFPAPPPQRVSQQEEIAMFCMESAFQGGFME